MGLCFLYAYNVMVSGWLTPWTVVHVLDLVSVCSRDPTFNISGMKRLNEENRRSWSLKQFVSHQWYAGVAQQVLICCFENVPCACIQNSFLKETVRPNHALYRPVNFMEPEEMSPTLQMTSIRLCPPYFKSHDLSSGLFPLQIFFAFLAPFVWTYLLCNFLHSVVCSQRKV